MTSADDNTEDLADGLDDVRAELAPGERYFLVRAAPWPGSGVEALVVGSDPNGELTHGIATFQPHLRGRRVARLAETEDLRRELLVEAWGLAVLAAGETVADVWECLAKVAPQIATARLWTFDLAYTAQTFVPAWTEDDTYYRATEGGAMRATEAGVERVTEAAA